MAHTQQLEFVSITKSLFPEMFVKRSVLEIGSLDINGSIRSYFQDCEYTGLDIAPGKGVDVVCEGQMYDAPDESFDVVISCEVMEHNPFWPETLINMIRMLKSGGLMVMSCATLGRKEHGTVRSLPGASPLMIEKGWNYYKNLTKWHVSWKVDLTSFSTKGFASNLEHWDLYFLGVEGASENRAERINAQKVAKFQALYGSRLFPVLFKRLRRVVRDPSLMTNMSARQGRW